jgi:Protein of unknown function (DUF3224)
MRAVGSFEVQITPQSQNENTPAQISLLFLSKQFQGDLQGNSKGQMLGAMTAVQGSGAYVALELVTGVLNGKHGSFVLQHKGTMRNGVYNMEVTVVPDSGTDNLVGISGTMKIIIEGGKHTFEFEYTIPSS